MCNCGQVAFHANGYSREELLSMNIRDLDVPEFAQRYETHTTELVREGSLCFKAADRCKDGAVMPVEVHACVLHFAGHDLVLSIVRDITDRKRAEAAMRQAQEMLEERVKERTAQPTKSSCSSATMASGSTSHRPIATLQRAQAGTGGYAGTCLVARRQAGHRLRARRGRRGPLVSAPVVIGRRQARRGELVMEGKA